MDKEVQTVLLLKSCGIFLLTFPSGTQETLQFPSESFRRQYINIERNRILCVVDGRSDEGDEALLDFVLRRTAFRGHEVRQIEEPVGIEQREEHTDENVADQHQTQVVVAVSPSFSWACTLSNHSNPLQGQQAENDHEDRKDQS